MRTFHTKISKQHRQIIILIIKIQFIFRLKIILTSNHLIKQYSKNIMDILNRGN